MTEFSANLFEIDGMKIARLDLTLPWFPRIDFGNLARFLVVVTPDSRFHVALEIVGDIVVGCVQPFVQRPSSNEAGEKMAVLIHVDVARAARDITPSHASVFVCFVDLLFYLPPSSWTSMYTIGVAAFEFTPFHELYRCEATYRAPFRGEGIIEAIGEQFQGFLQECAECSWDAQKIVVAFQTYWQDHVWKWD